MADSCLPSLHSKTIARLIKEVLFLIPSNLILQVFKQQGNMISYFCSVNQTVLQSSFKRVCGGDISSRRCAKWSWSWMRLRQKREGISTCEAHFQRVFMFFLKPFSGRSDYMNVFYVFVFIELLAEGFIHLDKHIIWISGALREKMRDWRRREGERMWKLKQRLYGVVYHFSCSSRPLFDNTLNSAKMCWKITVIPSKWH